VVRPQEAAGSQTQIQRSTGCEKNGALCLFGAVFSRHYRLFCIIGAAFWAAAIIRYALPPASAVEPPRSLKLS